MLPPTLGMSISVATARTGPVARNADNSGDCVAATLRNEVAVAMAQLTAPVLGSDP